ncbi:spectrin binding protein [Aureococcus anophagefferens]|uniref:Spectrin binding protein n=1 Tax=Aureococcus anophagefferens TaxID=44056 RepID=A0ABR1G9I6_AURAN
MLLRVASRRCAAAAARRRPLSVAAAGDDGALMDALRRCDDIYRRDVAPVNEALHGPLEHAYQPTVLPFVLLLGNHSSGKSSFANFALGRDVQTAGVAPTDDSFTVIAPGASDADQDGPALVGDPDLGFEGLRKFGPGLIQRTQLKIRSGISPKNFMLVDSPGMIDSPGGQGGGASSKLDRGYHFENAVKWFADRADVVLLFFDPDKPGTTGETLAILTNALAGQDHKLHIILNKADKFERIHDFARAYGALCWNLSKVIPRKDLPRIYTMCIPQGDAGAGGGALAAGLADLRKTRDDVLAELGARRRERAPAAPSGATAGLRRVLDHVPAPALRRAAAPASYGGFPRDAPEPQWRPRRDESGAS